MRWGLFSIAALCACWSLSAQAQSTITTTASTYNCTDLGCIVEANRALAPFDSSLGTLTAVTLQVDGSSNIFIRAYADIPPDPGYVHFNFEGPMDVSVNGVTYSFDVSGEQDFTLDYTHTCCSFTVSGSGTFNIDPSLFSSFIGTENDCDPYFSKATGICVSANYGGPVGPTSMTNVYWSGIGNNDYAWWADYTLTYTYSPFGVPEPSTWAMMLLGLGAIGFAVRRQRYECSGAA